MFSRKPYTLVSLVVTLAILFATPILAASKPLVEQERIIAGSPADSMEVHYLMLKGSNEAIGRRLAEIARDRYQAKPTQSPDPARTRANRLYIEKNYPILYERMRGVAAAFGQQVGDDAWDHAGINFTELHAACSIVQIPPALTSTGTSVVSRDYDYSTGNLTFGFLAPGMLHPTARPYLIELHPDHGYASVAMVAYDLLSGVLDGMNSEGLTVTMALDDEFLTKHPIEPTVTPGVGLGELQALRLLLDTCATVEEAKDALLQTKQYYQFVPIHYLIADRHGKSFVWEYSYAHNKEYIIENPGQPLVMTNFSLNQHMQDNKPPSADEARAVCKRYALLTNTLDRGGVISPELLSETHKKVDAETPLAAEPWRPPVRTLWHALYYPEERRARFSFYLRDEEIPGQPKNVRVVRSPYFELHLDATDGGKASSPAIPTKRAVVAAAAPQPIAEVKSAGEATDVVTRLRSGGATVKTEGDKVTTVFLDKAADPVALLPLLRELPDLTELIIQTGKMNDAGMAQLGGLSKLEELSLYGASAGDEGLKAVASLHNLRVLQIGKTAVTDAGLAHIAGLAKLEQLGLRGTAITDAGLAHLENLPSLTSINLGETRVTDAGLAHLTKLTKLEILSLQGDTITDAGMAQLGNLTNLTGLTLTGTAVTDAGLANLKPMKRLTKLNVTKTAVTDDGVAQAKKFLPFWATVTK